MRIHFLEGCQWLSKCRYGCVSSLSPFQAALALDQRSVGKFLGEYKKCPLELGGLRAR